MAEVGTSNRSTPASPNLIDRIERALPRSFLTALRSRI